MKNKKPYTEPAPNTGHHRSPEQDKDLWEIRSKTGNHVYEPHDDQDDVEKRPTNIYDYLFGTPRLEL